jgi:hypothetical protein
VIVRSEPLRLTTARPTLKNPRVRPGDCMRATRRRVTHSLRQENRKGQATVEGICF